MCIVSGHCQSIEKNTSKSFEDLLDEFQDPFGPLNRQVPVSMFGIWRTPLTMNWLDLDCDVPISKNSRPKVTPIFDQISVPITLQPRLAQVPTVNRQIPPTLAKNHMFSSHACRTL